MFIFRLALLLSLLFSATQAFAQTASPTEVVVASSEDPPMFGDNQFSDERLEKLLLEAAKSSDMSAAQKDRVQRILEGKGPFKRLQKNAMLRRAKAELSAQEMLDVNEDGQLIAAVDWASILKVLIEDILPILLKLFL